MGKLVVRLAAQNYKVVELYHQRLHGLLPHINRAMQQLQFALYPFLTLPPNRALLFSPTTEHILDTLHESKSSHKKMSEDDHLLIEERF